MLPPLRGSGTAGPSKVKADRDRGTWVYRFPKSRQLEFIIDPQGLVIQIAAYGAECRGSRRARV